MDQNPLDYLKQILNIIGYEDDMEKFAQEFLTMCMAQASAKVLSNLSPNAQKEIQEKLKKAKDQSEITTVLSEYQNITEYNNTLQQITQENFEEYIEEILPTLTQVQKERLLKFLSNQR